MTTRRFGVEDATEPSPGGEDEPPRRLLPKGEKEEVEDIAAGYSGVPQREETEGNTSRPSPCVETNGGEPRLNSKPERQM